MTRKHPLRGRIPAMQGPCSALRVATIRYGDYPGSSPGQANNEQLTYLLFGFGITSRFARYEPSPQQAGTPACCLKMADERAFLEDKAPNGADSNSKVLLGCSRPPYNQKSLVPAGYDWAPSPRPSPASGRGRFIVDGDELFDHYRHTLEHLGKQKGLQ